MHYPMLFTVGNILVTLISGYQLVFNTICGFNETAITVRSNYLNPKSLPLLRQRLLHRLLWKCATFLGGFPTRPLS